VVKRAFLVAVGGATLVIAGLSGCSSNDSSSSSSGSSSGTSAAATSAESGSGSSSGVKVTIDGQDQNISGTVGCTTAGSNVVIGIGDGATGIGATVSTGDSPVVHQVGLGNVNGVALGFQEGLGQGNAKAEKDGNTYTITGSATGIDMSNPLQPITKPFEIVVTCP
jgi:ipoprotein LpqH